jgi:hypothetical protein
MARNRKQRSGRGIRSRLQPESVVGDKNQSLTKAAAASKPWLGRLKEVLTSGIAVSVLMVIIAALAQRWFTEMGEHEKTRGELAREKDAKGTVTGERDQPRTRWRTSGRKTPR